MQQQIELINQMCRILANEKTEWEKLYFRGELNIDEGWNESVFGYECDGNFEYSFLSDRGEEELSKILVQLLDVMKSHTGGVWKAMTIKLEREKAAVTDFEY